MSKPDSSADLIHGWLLDALSDGVLLLDAEWRLVFVNPAAERLLGVSREDLVGKTLGRELPAPPPERAAVYRAVLHSRMPHRLENLTLDLPGLRGRVFDAEVHPSPAGGVAVVFRETTQRHRAEHGATRLGRILESSWNEIYIFSAESLRFLLVSKGAQENLGYSMEELHGLTPVELKPEYTPEAFGRLVAPLRSGEKDQVIYETHHRRKDGSLYPVEVRLQLAAAESPPVFIAVILDITERNRAQEQLEAQAMELEVLNEELRERTLELEEAIATRNRFYAAMSHELRTPINAIIGYNDLILAEVYGALQPRQRAGIERSQSAARHLREIVSDVLDISRLEAGKVVVQPEQVEVRPLLEDLAVTAEPLARRHACPLRLSLDDCPPSIVTDPRHVRQILLNLLSNAARFGCRRPVEVRCASAAGGKLIVEVIDRGVGIPPAEREHIFEEFVQLQPGDADEGTGLGLPISRRLAERLGGRLEVESTPGEGSIFRLTLPARTPECGGDPGRPAT